MEKIRVGKKAIGAGARCFIVAEVGSNHDGDLRRAKGLIRVSKAVGADAVKFQSFKAENLVERGHAAFNTLKRLELPLGWYSELKRYSDRMGIIFFSTPFDEERATLLHEIGVRLFKTASGDLTHAPLLRHIARFRKPVLISTGMSYEKEIARAIGIMRSEGNEKLILLHCVSCYPAHAEDFNLMAIPRMSAKFRLPAGLSDHSLGVHISIAAVALGASVIERHITLSKKFPGPDHSFALEPDEFEMMVRGIRDIEVALGNGLKVPRGSELTERTWARRGVYANVDIPKGSALTDDSVKCVRPFRTIAPFQLDRVIGRRARSTIKENEPIRLTKLK